MKLYAAAKAGKPLPALYSYIGAIPTLLKVKCPAKSKEYFMSLDAVDEALKICTAA